MYIIYFYKIEIKYLLFCLEPFISNIPKKYL